MNPEFVFLLNAVLVSRLVYVFREERLTGWGVLFLLAVQICGLLVFLPTLAWGILLALLSFVILIFHRAEKGVKETGGFRLASLAIETIILSVFCSPAFGITFNRAFLSWLASLDKFTSLCAIPRIVAVHGSDVILLGTLLAMNEVNLVLRLQLGWLRLGPETPSGAAINVDGRPEYLHGKIIGILERILIYMAVMSNQIAAIGLVLAAKGFVRFKEMDDRRFAEYVLIGTLLSALMAVLVALFVKALL